MASWTSAVLRHEKRRETVEPVSGYILAGKDWKAPGTCKLRPISMDLILALA
jgi:hypothetical protein